MHDNFFERYGGSAPENYERFFVPVIGEPLAIHLLQKATPRPAERVLDVSCGTGVVARLAKARVGDEGRVVGLDPNPGMLAVARSVTPPDMEIEWHQAGAEAMPLPDGAFDVVLCQMGLQFMQDKAAALREMRRVLAPGGRMALNVVGPTPEPFAVLAEALARHVGPQASAFVGVIFSLHDPGELAGLLEAGGFPGAAIEANLETLTLPAPEAFLWQYVHSTPLGALVAQVDDERRAALERDVLAKWRETVRDGAMVLELNTVVVDART